MDMKIKAGVIKKHRQHKLWSQEQLAEACGLGLRTIQRIEKSGNASYESTRAIASVFEVDVESLQYTEKPFTEYQHIQPGYLIMVIMFSVVSFALSFSYSEYPKVDQIEISIVAIIGLFCLIVGIIFSSLSIKVKEDSLSWHFGFKFWHKQVKIDEITSCVVVKNSILSGFGIRMMGSGWLYNVSGLLAVEVVLKSGKTIRLGTDEPEYLAQAIRAALEGAASVY